jgi:hypothetical protein
MVLGEDSIVEERFLAVLLNAPPWKLFDAVFRREKRPAKGHALSDGKE